MTYFRAQYPCSRCLIVTNKVTVLGDPRKPDAELCDACLSEGKDLGTVAGEAVAALQRFMACLKAETNPIAALEVRIDIGELHALILDLEAAHVELIQTLQGVGR